MFFQAREAANPFYDAVPDVVQLEMDRFAELTGRQYRLFDYGGAPDAERVVVLMGSGAGAAREAVEAAVAAGEKVGAGRGPAVPALRRRGVRRRAPLHGAAHRRPRPHQGAGRRSASRCTWTSSPRWSRHWPNGSRPVGHRRPLRPVVEGVHAGDGQGRARRARAESPKNHFTVGIVDDVTHTSLTVDESRWTEPAEVTRAVFYGLGSDGTVGANKNSVKIIGEHTDACAQGYFVYDSKKSGSITVSHLRFGPDPSARRT